MPSLQADPLTAAPALAPSVILSFDVEEHHRIEAAANLTVPLALQGH